MFKAISFCVFLGATSVFTAQNINDYEYISVPSTFEQKKINRYNLNTILAKSLQSKKYKIVSEKVSEWPVELQQNPCSVAKADILDDSSWLKNKILLQFKDCNDKVILSSKGDSGAKEFEIGFPEALKKSLVSIPVSSPDASKLTTKPTNVQQVVVSTPVAFTKPVQTNTSESFSDGNLNLQKVNISDSQFILVKPNSSQPYATFTEAGQQGLYRVVLENKMAAFGYFENGSLIVEIPQKEGNFTKQTFLSK